MLIKTINKVLITSMLAISFAKEPIAQEAISISGYVELVDLNNKIPIYLFMDEGHPFAYLDIFIYVDGKLENQTRVVTFSISNRPYFIEGFKYKNQVKNIRMLVCYVDEGIDDSEITFNLKGPGYKTVFFSESDLVKYQEPIPIKTMFSFQGRKSSLSYDYENISITGKHMYELHNTRFIDFSKYTLEIDTLKETNLEFCELKLYCKFENSDFVYVNNLYTATDIKLKKISASKYEGINEFSYYVDERDGSIRYSMNEYTNKDLLPFFMPFSLGENFKVEYSVVFYDVGMNHNDYIFNGIISKGTLDNNQFGKQYDFKYILIDEILEDIEYVS